MDGEAITHEQLTRIFWLDLEAGRLFWRDPPKNHRGLVGEEAGGPRRGRGGKSYWVICIGKRAYKRGRLIFFAIHGRLPSPCLDHISGDSLDDRPRNIREATVTENAWNHKKRRRRINLPMGVRLIPHSGRFEARISVNKKQIHLGAFDTPEEAATVYAAKRKEFFRDFA